MLTEDTKDTRDAKDAKDAEDLLSQSRLHLFAAFVVLIAVLLCLSLRCCCVCCSVSLILCFVLYFLCVVFAFVCLLSCLCVLVFLAMFAFIVCSHVLFLCLCFACCSGIQKIDRSRNADKRHHTQKFRTWTDTEMRPNRNKITLHRWQGGELCQNCPGQVGELRSNCTAKAYIHECFLACMCVCMYACA